MHANGIDGGVPLCGLDSADLLGVGAEDGALVRSRRQVLASWPLLEVKPAGPQFGLDGAWIGADPVGLKRRSSGPFTLVWKDGQTTHSPDC